MNNLALKLKPFLLFLFLRLVLKRREIKQPYQFPRAGLWNQVIQTSDCCFVFTGCVNGLNLQLRWKLWQSHPLFVCISELHNICVCLAAVKALNSIGLKQTITWNLSYPCRLILLTFCTQEGRVTQMQASFTLCTKALPSLASLWMMKMKKPGLKLPSSERRWSGSEVWREGKTRASRLLSLFSAVPLLEQFCNNSQREVLWRSIVGLTNQNTLRNQLTGVKRGEIFLGQSEVDYES